MGLLMRCATNKFYSIRECDGWMYTAWLRDGDRVGEESWYRGFLAKPVTLRTCEPFAKRCACGDVDPCHSARMDRYGKRL